jgi:hypothetical protein
VLVGYELSPGQPRVKPDGCVINTLWGELAWQLLGKDGYAYVADSDRQGVSPGSEVLRELFIQEHISVTLDMFHQFGLQIVTATPLERCEYLAPKMCTNLVVNRVRENIHIEDYRNYLARLREKYAE